MAKKSVSVQFTTDEEKQQFLEDQVSMLREIAIGIKTWEDLARFRSDYGYPKENEEDLKNHFQQLEGYDREGWITPLYDYMTESISTSNKESTSIDFEKGETTSQKNVALTDDQLSNPTELLKVHGFDPDKWILKAANNSKIERYGATADTYSYASRITVRPKTGNEITISDIDKYFDKFDGKKFNSVKIKPAHYDPKGEFLEVCLTDVHMGLLAWDDETGSSYDCDIARARVEKLMSDVIARCKGKKYKRIVLALLGDILHIDNMNGTTTKGTQQDTDTRPARLFDEALEMLIWCVQALGTIAPVEVVNVQGNHDSFSSYMLCRSLEMAYRNDDKVTFFNSPNPRKARKYGNVLIAWAHGDIKNNAMTEWLSNEFAEEWGSTKFREVHAGHRHSTQTLQKIEDTQHGLIARYLPALCASSAWEHSMAFPNSIRSLVCFVWNEETGLRDIWYNNV